MKKFLGLLLAVVLCMSAFTFIGCGPDRDEDEEGLEGVIFDKKSGEMYVESKDGKTRLKVSYATGYGDSWIRQLAGEFLKSDYGKTYYMVLDGDSEITTGISSKLEAGAGLSDIYMPLASNWNSYASQGQLEPLDDLYDMTIPGETKKVIEKIKGSWKTYGQTTYQNNINQYVFPWNENITGIVYNKTLFTEKGWTAPNTYAELKALCDQIVKDTNGAVAPFVYPGTVTGGYWDFLGTNWWLQLSGIDGLNEFMNFGSEEVYNPNKQPSAGKLGMLEAFEDLIVANRTKYILKGSASLDNLKAQVSFAQRKAAMIPNGSWIENESKDAIEDELAMMQTPILPNALKDGDGNAINYNYTGPPDFMLIPKDAANKAGAKTFLSFLCRDDMLEKYTTLTGAPRPFDYDLTKCEVSDFIKSCLNVWSNSTSWFESSTSPLWTAGKTKKYQTSNPYTGLLSNSTLTAIAWSESEYAAVKATWPTWIA